MLVKVTKRELPHALIAEVEIGTTTLESSLYLLCNEDASSQTMSGIVLNVFLKNII